MKNNIGAALLLSTLFCSLLSLVLSQSAQGEETPEQETVENASVMPSEPATDVTVDHSESHRIMPDSDRAHSAPGEARYVSERSTAREFDYDHCHFDEAHQHHHCYEAGEHDHVTEVNHVYVSESHVHPHRTYRHYSTRRTSPRYYSSSNSYYTSRRNNDNWNSVALGLAIGIPLAYSQHNYGRGYYGRGNYNRGNYRGNRHGYNRNSYRGRGNNGSRHNRRGRH